MNPLCIGILPNSIHWKDLFFNTQILIRKINNDIYVLAPIDLNVSAYRKTPTIVRDFRILELKIYPVNTKAIQKLLALAGHANDKESFISKILRTIGSPYCPS